MNFPSVEVWSSRNDLGAVSKFTQLLGALGTAQKGRQAVSLHSRVLKSFGTGQIDHVCAKNGN
jgi:hypothetical protein